MKLRRLLASQFLDEALKYGAVGVTNTLITLSIIVSLIYWLHASALLANAIGYLIGFGYSFIFNRLWTFRSQAPIGRSMLRYVASALLAYGLNATVICVGVTYLGVSEYWIQPAGAIVYTVGLFLLSRAWVFAGPCNRKVVQ